MIPKHIAGLIILPLVFLIAVCSGVSVAQEGQAASKSIVCFGASITKGIGADDGYDYPSYLRKMVAVPVINSGVEGNTTRDELRRLGIDVLQYNPQMVIITQRANDLKHNIPKEETLNNLETIITRIQERGARIVLVTIEPKVLQENYFKDFRELAHKKKIELMANGLKDIDLNPQYMHDDVHPNNEGYRLLAERIYKKIKPLLN